MTIEILCNYLIRNIDWWEFTLETWIVFDLTHNFSR